MSESSTPFIEQFNNEIKEAEIFTCMARASELQESAIARLQDLSIKVTAEKNRAIENKDENYSNLLLGCQCVVSALTSELNMLVLLKSEKPEEAWDELIKAQNSSIDAVRANDGFKHLELHNKKLEAYEKLLFPSQIFTSTGTIIKHQECSICGEDYEDCSHLVGKPYFGEFCYIIARDFEFDHVAFVDHPADKRCRITGFRVEGGTRNRMTWRIENDQNS